MGWADRPRELYQAQDSADGTVPVAEGDSPAMVGSLTFDEFMDLGQEGMEEYQYGPEMEAMYGEPVSPIDEPEEPKSLFQKEPLVKKSILPVKPKGLAPNIRANNAIAETILTGDPGAFDRTYNDSLNGTVMSETAKALLAQDSDGFLAAVLKNPDMSVDQKIEAMKFEVQRSDWTKLSPYTTLLFQYMLQDGGELVPASRVDATARTINPMELRDMVRAHRAGLMNRGRRIVDDWAAEQGFENYGHMFADVLVQDFIPVFNVLSRLGINQAMLEASGAKIEGGWRNLFPGEIRQTIRDHLLANPADFESIVQDMKDAMTDLQKDELYGPLLTQYGVLESWEAIFTEDLLTGRSSLNTIDRWIGNLEVGLEALLLLPIVGTYTGVAGRGLFRAVDRVMPRAVARSARNAKLTAKLDSAIASDVRASKFQVLPDEATVARLPRPAALADDLDRLPEGAEQILERNEALRADVMDIAGRLTGRGLTIQDKADTTLGLINDIHLNDRVQIHTPMSTIRPLEGDAGIEVVATVGRTADEGWTDIEELLTELVDLDPAVKDWKVVRTTADGTLEEILDGDTLYELIYRKTISPSKAGDLFKDGEFFLQYRHQRYWHPTDAKHLPGKGLSSGAFWLRKMLNPNARFTKDFVKNVNTAYLDEQVLSSKIGALFQEFHSLNKTDKQRVATLYEWGEQFGKDTGRAPTLAEYAAHVPDATAKDLNAVISLRTGMDTLYDVFNQRLYREWAAKGFKTIKGTDPSLKLPQLSGKILDKAEVRPWMMYDPVQAKNVQFNKKQLKKMLEDGRYVVMKLDMPIDAGKSTVKAEYILVDTFHYNVGDLTMQPLKYHPGYSFRFYDDPYYIVKEGTAYVNGKKTVTTEAIRTAGTLEEATRWRDRANYANTKRNRKDTFKVVRARDLSQEESSLFMKETLNREGRLFWDERMAERLPDVNGNRAELMDPGMALEKGIALASRQLSQEDVVRSLKEVLLKQYKTQLDAIGGKLSNNLNSMKELSDRFGDAINNTADITEKAKLRAARELLDYIRFIQGTNGKLVPAIRSTLIDLGTSIHRMMNRKVGRKGKVKGARAFRRYEQWAESANPFSFMNTVAYNVFMVFRPLRQLAMQAAQIGLLAGQDAAYMATGRIFREGLALRYGFHAKRGFIDDVIKRQKMASTMHMTVKEYDKLVHQFDRAGLIDAVDVHSFAGNTKKGREKKTQLGTYAEQARQFVQNIGFNAGESANQYMTYLVATRKFMRLNNLKSVLDISDEGWEAIRWHSTNMSLGMNRVNSFGYQSGMFQTMTQFLSFTHKSALTMMGLNPSIKGADVLKLWAASTLLYGGNFFGIRDYVYETLKSSGLEEYGDRVVPGLGGTIIDLISAGLIDKTFNTIGSFVDDDWKDLDFSFLAPGIDFKRMWDMQLGAILEQPIGKSFFGAFGNIFSSTAQALDMASNMVKYPDTAEGKLEMATKVIMSGAFPVFRDAMQAHLAYKYKRWFTNAGEPLPIDATMNEIIARAALGIRSKEQWAALETSNDIWENDEEVDDFIKQTRTHLRKYVLMFKNNEIRAQDLRDQMQFVALMLEDAPEGRGNEILQRIFFTEVDPGAQNMADILLEAMPRGAVTPEMIQRIDLFPDIPETEREILKQMATEAWDSRLEFDEQIPARLEEEATLIEDDQ